MGLYLLTDKKRLTTSLNKTLRAIGGDQALSLSLVRLPHLTAKDIVFVDFSFLARVPLKSVATLLFAAHQSKARLIFIVRKTDNKAVNQLVLSIDRSSIDLLPLPLTKGRLKRLLR